MRAFEAFFGPLAPYRVMAATVHGAVRDSRTQWLIPSGGHHRMTISRFEKNRIIRRKTWFGRQAAAELFRKQRGRMVLTSIEGPAFLLANGAIGGPGGRAQLRCY